MFRIILSMIGIALMFLAFTILAPVTPEGAIIAAFAGLVIIAFLTVRTPVRKGIRRMPSNPQVLLPMMLFMLFTPVVLFAQDSTAVHAAAPTLWEQVVPALITIIVPLTIAFIKQIIPLIPKWLLPILAPILGVVLSLLLDASGNTGIILGAVYGGLGTWLREFIKQLQQAATQSTVGT